ncbi:AraC-like DNA-binding protein [Dyadobacter sp. BE34]|uniref:AraC-like DNA-binding protein n=1 Tax=Dyadobacter fermentans TaxID=94254 RepID=A0ABU1R6J6_9BACT|nr:MULTISPECIES: helix-turn-helix transcriptional regulator [Dyadobacter]MDR6808539.1 AraC-like DNA-binding protein [Dyadobacter fermentans]MDR7046282.1 AraC-like DNA-binding protein [Dyadobacter sp. BE242]MDR7200595.1 AraC-like DNA-binding protein [Dyadobacter sp. BE34]MDR7218555.1 AraC-like DNA-binding protein [Dyadobacter sp. BE31]MDR7266485.1 AraC-like DNA-binding protein [Dyadobacter sp. BE32]
MAYIEYHPHPALAPYIDAYWKVTGDNMPLAAQTILPDGCVDIIMNLGEDELPDADGFFMKNERSYLVGTMSRAIETTVTPGSLLIGVRFRPAGFAAFYQYDSMHEFTDRTAEFDPTLAPDLRARKTEPKPYLDQFFLRRLRNENRPLTQVIGEIESKNGLIDVTTLAQNSCMSIRQLQRTFKQHIGLSPKEFLNIIRFRYAVELIKTGEKQSLLDIALEAGYYDHAHLTNEIRRYAGIAPSLI